MKNNFSKHIILDKLNFNRMHKNIEDINSIFSKKISEAIKDINAVGLFTNIICSFKLELSINKELYEKGSISKELYEKVANIILERMKPFVAIMEV